MLRKIYLVKVFTKNPKFGNLAGVVPTADGLSKLEMQKIAKKVGASETAFIFSSKKAAYKIRWFTPKNEVGLCVHATIASVAVMKKLKMVSVNNFKLETKNTVLEINAEKNQVTLLIKGYKPPSKVKRIADVCNLLNIKENDLVDIPVVVSIYSDSELIVPVRDLSVLENLKPNMKKYTKLCKLLRVTGISVFTREVFNKENSLHTREFAPLYGYLEDPLTGLAAGAIAQYLSEQKPNLKIIKVEQGNFIKKPGQIIVQKSTSGFYIGGKYIILKKFLNPL
jgi:PhzF family phenazine biosynthesis protein